MHKSKKWWQLNFRCVFCKINVLIENLPWFRISYLLTLWLWTGFACLLQNKVLCWPSLFPCLPRFDIWFALTITRMHGNRTAVKNTEDLEEFKMVQWWIHLSIIVGQYILCLGLSPTPWSLLYGTVCICTYIHVLHKSKTGSLQPPISSMRCQ